VAAATAAIETAMPISSRERLSAVIWDDQILVMSVSVRRAWRRHRLWAVRRLIEVADNSDMEGVDPRGRAAVTEGSPTVREIDTGGMPLRSFAARGMIINGAFDVGLGVLTLIQGFVMAALLTRSQYGIWGILVVSLGVLAQLKLVGISDKYLQQNETDQELAFQKAFTLELVVSGIMMVPLVAVLPVIAVVYGHWELVPPGLVLLSVLAADGLQSPLWIYYRRMHFARQRALDAVEPVVGFVVSVGLAIAGLGYWALALGFVAGAWAGAIAAIANSPFRVRWRFDRQALRVYSSFSAPIFISTACTVVLANVAMIVTNFHLGLAGAGALALSTKITEFTTRVDALISTTLYPAICAIQDRLELLRESFVKSNRLALMWAMPFGFGLALFAADLVRFVIGEKWHAAIGLLRIMGIVAAINHVGFNWDGYFRARAQTMPIAIVAVLSTITMLGVGIPLLITHGLTGLGIGLAAGAAVQLVLRAWYLSGLFKGFGFVSHAIRAMLPTVLAGGVVLVMRALERGPRDLADALAELAVYLLGLVLATWLIERPLLNEALRYLRARPA
jgi:O-antigen/teichoic acid export membrane protein